MHVLGQRTEVNIPDVKKIDAYLDLVNVNLPILLADLFVSYLHRIHGGHRVPKVLRGKGCGFHVEALLRKLRNLSLVHPFLLECAEGPLLDCVLDFRWTKTKVSCSMPSLTEEGLLFATAPSLVRFAACSFAPCIVSAQHRACEP